MARTRTAAALALVAEDKPLRAPSDTPVVASASPLPLNRKFTPQYTEGQQAAFTMWRQVDAFYAGVRWLSNALSRVRLVVATTTDDGTEPQRVESGPAVEILNRLAGGAAGQSQLMAEYGIHYSVTGECWLVGELPDPTGEFGGSTEETWRVLSAAELRIADSARSRRQFGATTTYEIRDGIPTKTDGLPPWRPINPESLVVRCWRQDPQFGWMADSPGLHAMPALVLLDLADKRIQSEILSRIVSNGILLFDDGRLSIPGRTPGQGADVSSASAFGEMLVEVASQAIANPASPSSCLPIPIGHSNTDPEYDPKNLMQLIEFPSSITANLMDIRTMAVSRTATALDIPDEYLNQTRTNLNHWGLSQVSDEAIDGPISATAQLICQSLTIGFLGPMMAAEGLDLRNADGSRTCIWFDVSELETPPDSSDDAKSAYDRAVISEEAYRRRIGETEDAAPDVEEQTRILLKQQAAKGSIVALQILNGDVELADAAQTADPGVREAGAPGSEREAPPAMPPGSEPATSPDDAPPVTASAQHVVIEYRKQSKAIDPAPADDDA